MSGAVLMAKKKKPDAEQVAGSEGTARITIINLKGSAEQSAWLDSVHKKTHIAKSVIVRLALAEWAERNGHPAFPMETTDEG